MEIEYAEFIKCLNGLLKKGANFFLVYFLRWLVKLALRIHSSKKIFI
ncbi:hypothetical protein LBBP_03449 [Leptospira borgpetersenii serovar Ballum]|uniref:Uncharacterized protein n=1 Tax=Leptospira borgpetersenii serovar Ballum TaxID=280505 RepID=A0A0S2IVG8_LEPBO|nr:hypothetical protein LBBP_03449 [Leptospira borgpetersenii serovar Ballum]